MEVGDHIMSGFDALITLSEREPDNPAVEGLQLISQLQQIEKMSQELIRSLNVVVENYPELKADSLYSKMMDDIQEQNENVGAAISIFNRNVELFNNQIEVFPNNLINTLTLSKKAIRPFRDNLVNENFDYKPNF